MNETKKRVRHKIQRLRYLSAHPGGMSDLIHALRRNPLESGALVALAFLSSLAFLYVDASHQNTFALFLFAPIVLAALAFGTLEGAATAVLASLFILPWHLFAEPSPEPVRLWLDHGIRTLWLVVIGVLVGMLAGSVRNLEGQVNTLRGVDPASGNPDSEAARKQMALLLSSTTERNEYANITEVRVSNYQILLQRFGARRMDDVMQTLAERIRQVMPAGTFVSRSASDSLSAINKGAEPWDPSEQAARLRTASDAPFRVDGVDIHAELVSSTTNQLIKAHRTSDKKVAQAAASARLDSDDAAQRLLTRVRNNLMAELDGEPTSPSAGTHCDPQLASDLAKAIEHQEIRITFQPVLHLGSRKYGKVEALPRWRHPTCGLVPPSRFLALIEHAGLIKHFTRWMVEDIVECLAAWQSRGCKLVVYLSLHPQLLLDRSFFADVAQDLRDHDLSVEQLILQIDERHIMSLKGHQLRHLLKSGMRCAVDSYDGTHAPLSHLRTMPVSAIKLDGKTSCYSSGKLKDPKSFRTIVRVAHDLGLSVSAYNIDSQLQLDEFKTLGCNELQGQLLGKALERDQVETTMGVNNTGSGLDEAVGTRTGPDLDKPLNGNG